VKTLASPPCASFRSVGALRNQGCLTRSPNVP
jgi:hypothetical protein